MRGLALGKAAKRPTRPTTNDDLAIVRATLQNYATRGTFRSYAETPARGRKVVFRFNWFRDVTFTVTFDPVTRTLIFQDLLPAVRARSEMDRDVRAFVRDRESKALPEHRRVDPRKLAVTIQNRTNALSMVCKLKGRHAEYGVRKAVHLVHEIFTDLLTEGRFAEYQVEHFRLDPEMA